jgi:hypothetical protein
MSLVQLSDHAAGKARIQAGAPRLEEVAIRGTPLTEGFPGGHRDTAKEEVLSSRPETAVGLMGKGHHHTPASRGVTLGLGSLAPGSSVPRDLTSCRHVEITGRVAYGDVGEEVRKLTNPIGPNIKDGSDRIGHLRNQYFSSHVGPKLIEDVSPRIAE